MDFDFHYDENGEKTTLYYILGERPLKVTCVDSLPVKIQALDFEARKFIIDNTLIKRINDAVELRKVNEADFRNFCLSKGIKPI